MSLKNVDYDSESNGGSIRDDFVYTINFFMYDHFLTKLDNNVK